VRALAPKHTVMKSIILVTLLAFPFLLVAQSPIDYSDQEMISMSATEARTYDGNWTYFPKGSSTPFTGILFATFENGNYQSVQEYVDGVGNGTWINYYEDGTIQEMGTYVNNRVEGPMKIYFPNGQLQAEGQYADWRVRVGIWNYYDEGGTLLSSEDYGTRGDLRDIESFYDRGDISYQFYNQIRARYNR
jgi:antitoxin component YwqK of YwqJK toxin-antitoxin module